MVLNKNKEIKEKENIIAVKDYELKKAYGKIKEQEKIITLLRNEIDKQDLAINILKEERFKQTKIDKENKKKWLNGFHGETYRSGE